MVNWKRFDTTAMTRLRRSSYMLRMVREQSSEKRIMPQKPRAVLVLVPGVNDSGSGFLEETSWKRFVSERSWALVGATFVSPVDILKWNGGYYNPAEESGRMLLDSLSRQGLGRLPIYIYGFSGGARFAARFAETLRNSGGWCQHCSHCSMLAWTVQADGIWIVGR